MAAQIALAPFAGAGGTLPAGSAVFAADDATKAKLAAVGKERGLHFKPAQAASLPALDPVDHAPRIAVLTALRSTRTCWSLRNLGFTADPISTATLNTALTDPLESYDVVFNTVELAVGGEPARADEADRILRPRWRLSRRAARTAANFLTNGAQLVGLTALSRSGNGRSGILYWENTARGREPDCRRLSRDRHADRGSADVVQHACRRRSPPTPICRTRGSSRLGSG